MRFDENYIPEAEGGGIACADLTWKSGDRFHLVAEASPNAMIMVAADGVIALVNSRTEMLFGYNRAELLGQSMEMLVPERFRPRHGSQRTSFFGTRATRATGKERDLFGLRKDGGEVPVEIGLNPIHTSDGPYVLASIVDISERLKMEDRFQLVVEASPSAMIMVGTDGLITLVNTQTERLFGYDRAELLGQEMEMLLPERFRGKHAEQRAAFFAAPAARPMGKGRDLFGLRSDGSEVPVEITLNPIATAEGPCVLASIIDITGRRKRTNELRQALAEKTMLLKEVHHRVKNNLQVICSLLSMQIECSEGDQSARPLNDAHSRVLAMSLIHEQIYQSDTLVDLDFGEYVELLSHRLFNTYCVDASRVRLELSAEPIRLNMHRAIPCGLILNELISNALKHAFRDGREGVIRIGLQKTEAGRVEMTVEDNGVGFAEDFRWETSQSLGLQVVRTLIHQLRARFSVVTGENGLQFQFSWLPDAGECISPASASGEFVF